VTLAIRPARGLAAVAECLEVARIAGRPAARAVREVDDRYFSVDGLLIGKIGRVRRAAVGYGDARQGSIGLILKALLADSWGIERSRYRGVGVEV
jgi:hypothetical protein